MVSGSFLKQTMLTYYYVMINSVLRSCKIYHHKILFSSITECSKQKCTEKCARCTFFCAFL